MTPLLIALGFLAWIGVGGAAALAIGAGIKLADLRSPFTRRDPS